MATKKGTPKKAAKVAKPAKKAPAKPSRPVGKAVAKKPAKPAPKPAAKKAAPSKKVAAKPAPKKAAPKPVAKKPAPAPKKAPVPPKKSALPVKAAPSKPVSVKAAPAKVAPVKTAPQKAAPVKTAAPEKVAEPVKKPVVAAPSTQEVKPAIQPLQRPVARKEPPKPVKVVIPKTSTTRAVKYEPDFTRSVLDTPHHENTGPTMRYSDSELTEFKDLILKKLDTAKKELSYLQGLITRKDEGGDMEDGRYMTMEDGSMSMEREQLSQMASRQIQFIDHLEKALMRIENKTYGICRVTGKLIDKARLRAVPHATLSIEAKQMMNK
jgi:RNA polymerase-binding transcription factor DksA